MHSHGGQRASRWFSRTFLPGLSLLLLSPLAFNACQPKVRNFETAVEDSPAAVTTTADALETSGQNADGTTLTAPVASTQPEQPSEEAAGNDDDARQPGSACSQAGDCESGYCVDGLCCETPCADVCSTCAAPGNEGNCSATSSDVACGTLSCGSASDCRGYDLSQTELNCAAIGECLTAIACEAFDQAAGSACQDNTGTCVDNGACLVPGKAVLGTSCATNDDCGEGHCVAGPDGALLCCDSACDGLCQACSADGHCNASAVTDERCTAVACPADSVCRDYDEQLTDNLCRGFGQCKDAQDCSYVALKPSASCSCDDEGSCELLLGQRCGSDEECGLSACEEAIDGGRRCCAEACGPGLTSNQAGTACVACVQDSIECQTDTQLTCIQGEAIGEDCALGCTVGVGCNVEAPLGYQCNNAGCQQGSVCQADTAGVQRCCSRDCAAEGKQCAPDGSCTCPPGQSADGDDSCLLQQGDPCSDTGTACQSGLACVDGVCCNSGCDESCATCSAPGSIGQCIYDAQDNGSCAVGQACYAQGECRATPGEACAQGNSCLSGSCSARIGDGAAICCEQACDGNSRCSSDGSRCVECESNDQCPNGCNTNQGVCNPLRPSGSTCDVSSQCGTGICSAVAGSNQNRCCPNCGGGQVCDASGQCGCPNNQVFINGQCRRLNGQTCNAGQGFSCQSGNCEAAVDGRNLCCTDNCAAGTQLCAANGAGCIDQGGAVGESCNTGGDCLNGNCVDGVCCNQACGGQCERCNAPGNRGNCSEDRGNSCQGGRSCFGRGQCLATIGQTCNNVSCGEGSCENTLGNGAAICCEEACSARRPFCETDARSCTQSDGGSCQQNNDCDSGNCNSGTCCSQNCPAIDCSDFAEAGNVCETFPSGLVTANLCSNSGACRSAEQVCNGLRQTAGTNVRCDSPATTDLNIGGTCNGAGTCVTPNVVCGNTTCILDRELCCQKNFQTSQQVDTPFECVTGAANATISQGGPRSDTCRKVSPDRVIACDEPSDCRSGDVCCLGGNQGGTSITCVPELDCNGASRGRGLLCASPAGVFNNCASGQQCTADRFEYYSSCTNP